MYVEAGIKSAGDEKFRAILERETKRRSKEVQVTGRAQWCSYQHANLEKLGVRNVFVQTEGHVAPQQGPSFDFQSTQQPSGTTYKPSNQANKRADATADTGNAGEAVFNLLCVGMLLASVMLWLIGSLGVLFAVFRPKKMWADKKARRLLIASFVNAALYGFAYQFPTTADAIFKGMKTAFVSSTPYAEGTLALGFVIFVWVSPVIVIGTIVWLAFSLLASMTASEVQRRQGGQK